MPIRHQVRRAGAGRITSLYADLVGFWKLEETDGTRFDASPNANNLTDNNTVTRQQGVRGFAAEFVRANSENLSIADNATLSMAAEQSFSISAWVYLDALGSGDDERGIVCKGNTSTGAALSEYHLRYIGSPTARFNILIGDGTTNFVSLSAAAFGAPALTTWYHLVAWHDAVANEVRIRVNDQFEDSVAYTFGSYDSADAMRIGGYSNNTNFLDGRVDAVGIWKRTLTAAERSALYNGGRGREHPF